MPERVGVLKWGGMLQGLGCKLFYFSNIPARGGPVVDLPVRGGGVEVVAPERKNYIWWVGECRFGLEICFDITKGDGVADHDVAATGAASSGGGSEVSQVLEDLFDSGWIQLERRGASHGLLLEQFRKLCGSQLLSSVASWIWKDDSCGVH